MRKKMTIDIDEVKHAQFKSKAAAQGLTLRAVLDLMIDDYLTGKYKPTQKGKAQACSTSKRSNT